MRWHLLHDTDHVGDLRRAQRAGPPPAPRPSGTDAVTGDAVDQPGAQSRRIRITVLSGVALLLAAGALDATIISVALPTIRNDLGGSAEFLQWVASIYFLAAAIVLVPAGRMVDLVGPKRVLVVGGLVYLAGAILAALAWSPVLLVVGRAVQGGATGIVSPAALVLLSGVFGARRRGTGSNWLVYLAR